jgi:hypothetical protein
MRLGIVGKPLPAAHLCAAFLLPRTGGPVPRERRRQVGSQSTLRTPFPPARAPVHARTRKRLPCAGGGKGGLTRRGADAEDAFMLPRRSACKAKLGLVVVAQHAITVVPAPRTDVIGPRANTGRRDVASWPNGEYRGFLGRHLSRPARPGPPFGYTCRASVTKVSVRAGRSIPAFSQGLRACAGGVAHRNFTRSRIRWSWGRDPVRLRRAGERRRLQKDRIPEVACADG